jgi:hypothetical protein
MTPIMGRYAVYCIYHRYTIIVHRIEMMGTLKLLESYKWKKITYGNQSKRDWIQNGRLHLDEKWIQMG